MRSTEPGISVVDAALRATTLGASAMHDPTEGGLSAGLYEMAEAAQVGLVVSADAVLWYEPGRTLARALGIDPWGLLASGALLAAFPAGDAGDALATLAAEGFSCAAIARAVAGSGVGFESGAAVPRFARDEMIRVVSPDG